MSSLPPRQRGAAAGGRAGGAGAGAGNNGAHAASSGNVSLSMPFFSDSPTLKTYSLKPDRPRPTVAELRRPTLLRNMFDTPKIATAGAAAGSGAGSSAAAVAAATPAGGHGGDSGGGLASMFEDDPADEVAADVTGAAAVGGADAGAAAVADDGARLTTTPEPIVSADVDAEAAAAAAAAAQAEEDAAKGTPGGRRALDRDRAASFLKSRKRKAGKAGAGAGAGAGKAAAIEYGLEDEEESEATKGNKFGMWDGVFARCLLNIFGVIMFLRLGWMVGYAGIGASSGIIIVSSGLTLITTYSLSSICTNGTVSGGGAYFLISRSLGPEYGGAIGLMFFAANAVAIALYLVGFAETIVGQAGVMIGIDWDLRMIATGSLLLLLVLCFVGVSWVIKFQLVLLGVLVISIISFIVGCFIPPSDSSDPAFLGFAAVNHTIGPDTSWLGMRNFLPDFTGNAAQYPEAAAHLRDIDGEVTLGICLAVFFPAVTGIMAGANISGDLKDPGYAIPVGTIRSVVVSTFVYIALAFLIGLVSARTVLLPDGQYGGLLHDSLLMAKLSFWPPLVYAGIYAATLSSGLASLVGAPRILQAVATDNLFPGLSYFSKMSKSQEPVRAYVVTFVIALACIATGELNVIAPLITNFFMASYALVNYACFYGEVSRSPGWRPTFKTNKFVALFGTVCCFGLMMFLNVIMGIATIVIGAALYKFVERTSGPNANWGSAQQGLRYIDAIKYMVKLSKTAEHVKTWRPQLLVLSGAGGERPGLELFGQQLEKGKGVMVMGSVMKMSFEQHIAQLENAGVGTARRVMDQYIRKTKMRGFGLAVVARSLDEGVRNMIMAGGFGRVRANTVVMGLKTDWALPEGEQATSVKEYVDTIGTALDLKCGVVLVAGQDTFLNIARDGPHTTKEGRILRQRCPRLFKKSIVRPGTGSRIDVWWVSDDGGLTVLLPHIMLRHWRWRGAKLRILVAGTSVFDASIKHTMVVKMMERFRIPCEVEPVVNDAPTSPSDEALERHKAFGIEGPGERIADSTKAYLKLGELIERRSHDAAITYVSLPVPRRDANPKLYLAWLHALCPRMKPARGTSPRAMRENDDLDGIRVQMSFGRAGPRPGAYQPRNPVVLLRGSQESVLTFHS